MFQFLCHRCSVRLCCSSSLSITARTSRRTLNTKQPSCQSVVAPAPEDVPSDNVRTGAPAKGITSSSASPTCRFNVAQIQMIPNNLRDVLFGKPVEQLSVNDAERCIEHLRSKGLWGFQPQVLTEPNLILPNLYGKNIEEHLRKIASDQIRPYVAGVDELLIVDPPAFPKKWEYSAGWTKYCADGTRHSVPFPDEPALVFDVETCLSSGKYPTLAAAVSASSWYTWCSEQLVDDSPAELTADGRLKLQHLIPLESPGVHGISGTNWIPRLVIGHNVAFDRSYIMEQYLQHGSKMRFLDTMSLHIALAGFTTAQRGLFLKYTATDKRVKTAKEVARQIAIKNNKKKSGTDTSPARRWMDVGSMNNLEDVYRLHCQAKLPYDKTLSNVFVSGTLDNVREDFQSLMTYCASDVRATHHLAQTLLPLFREALPHPASFGGMLEMSATCLPVNKNWEVYIQRSNEATNKIEDELKIGLAALAKEAVLLQKDDAWQDDMWLWDLDWTSQKVTARTKNPKYAALPAWYRALCDNDPSDSSDIPTATDISLKKRAVPKLMRLTWNDWPLHHSPTYGWGWLEPLPEGVVIPESKTKVQDPDKKITPAMKRQMEAVFPLHKLKQLAEQLKRPVRLPITVNEEPKQKSTALSDEEWDRMANMTPDEQQALLSGKLEEAEMPHQTPATMFPTSSLDAADAESDWEIIATIHDQLELEEAKERSKPKPKKTAKAKKNKDPAEENAYYDVVPGCIFRRLPHTNGAAYNVGSPLSRDFLQHFESGVLRASFGSASEIIKRSKMASYWHNNKDRVESQLVGSLTEDEEKRGVILPRVVVMGTVTRRAVEATWMTASNIKPDRIGSELKAMIQAPRGYNIVGADVDSQELWIAAVLGDAYWLKQHGCTAFGWMTLQGNKADGTDLHSKTAEQAGISRDHAKILNYGRIYGAGREYAALLMRNFNRELTEAESESKAKKIYSFAKGSRLYTLNAMGKFLGEQCGFMDSELDMQFKSSVIRQIWEQAHRKKVSFDDRSEFITILRQITEDSKWTGGSESNMFNKLESIARSLEPRTPVLGCRVSRCLLKENVEDDFMTSRVNWVVQSSAVDYLHIMLVLMRWLIDTYSIDARFCLSIHDEVRYIVAERDRYRLALALHMTNLMTRAMFAHKLGFNDLPQSVAYFSAVDVDKVMRKEVNTDCMTPSNSEGLEKNYGVMKGETVDVFQALEKTGGAL
ncbi:DNA polymerase subunit gamma-1-like isoform X2 [Paramacrobiotus metropolitanus]|uniref:DNA polymerase subunit gamma-1-like isoform X2 n=1 Tax=Paramacrobiotus metropolitanus TaxID=2943436 RepID=UPI002445A1BE|nr:DNA polymerase subunit gamma-1-like isoform X2 [Paramacrobiotus metropolitanus]